VVEVEFGGKMVMGYNGLLVGVFGSTFSVKTARSWKEFLKKIIIFESRKVGKIINLGLFPSQNATRYAEK
jgi:hypothetical protein